MLMHFWCVINVVFITLLPMRPTASQTVVRLPSHLYARCAFVFVPNRQIAPARNTIKIDNVDSSPAKTGG